MKKIYNTPSCEIKNIIIHHIASPSLSNTSATWANGVNGDGAGLSKEQGSDNTWDDGDRGW